MHCKNEKQEIFKERASWGGPLCVTSCVCFASGSYLDAKANACLLPLLLSFITTWAQKASTAGDGCGGEEVELSK